MIVTPMTVPNTPMSCVFHPNPPFSIDVASQIGVISVPVKTFMVTIICSEMA